MIKTVLLGLLVRGRPVALGLVMRAVLERLVMR